MAVLSHLVQQPLASKPTGTLHAHFLRTRLASSYDITDPMRSACMTGGLHPVSVPAQQRRLQLLLLQPGRFPPEPIVFVSIFATVRFYPGLDNLIFRLASLCSNLQFDQLLSSYGRLPFTIWSTLTNFLTCLTNFRPGYFRTRSA